MSSANNDPIIGIDLGTTNSCSGVVKNGKPFVIPSREGHNTVPSIVALNQRGKLIVGHPAKAQMLTNPTQTVYGSKRLVGRPYASPIVQQIRDRFHYNVVEGPGGEAAVKLGEDVYTLQQISAFILKEVKDRAQDYLGTEVKRAVVTCPAYYNDNQRQAVREAGALAGLEVLRILNEPTAAALAFGWGRSLSQKVLVYDLGGGTFDASLLDLKGNLYEVLSTGGDTFLGGVDFDTQLVDHLMMEFQLKTGHPFSGDRVALQRITEAAERAKCSLSEQSSVRVHVPFVTMIGDQPFDLDLTLTRDQLYELTGGLVERTIASCEEVLSSAGVKPGEVDEVLLVGGQSRMPLVKDRLQAYFNKAPHKGVHPDEAVALGAAILAHSLQSEEAGIKLVDVLPMSIGLALPSGMFKVVVARNTRLPHTKSYKLKTTRDDQTELKLVVHQGDQALSKDNEFLGTVTLSGLAGGPKGLTEVVVTFELSPASTLTVIARDTSTGRNVKTAFATRRQTSATTDVESSDPSSPATAGMSTLPATTVAEMEARLKTQRAPSPSKPGVKAPSAPAPAPGLWAKLMSMFKR
jgi:molecular chaperone DnaK